MFIQRAFLLVRKDQRLHKSLKDTCNRILESFKVIFNLSISTLICINLFWLSKEAINFQTLKSITPSFLNKESIKVAQIMNKNKRIQ
jgi:hypothetical protein